MRLSYLPIAGEITVLTIIDPVISTQPLSQTASNGQMVTFTVGVTGTAPLNYQWRKDGVLLTGETTTSLTLTNVQWANSGSYDLIACGEFACATSAVATLSFPLELDSQFNPGAGGGDYPRVYAMAAQMDGKILVGGSFSSVAGQTRNRIARLNSDGTLDNEFNPDVGRKDGNIPSVSSLAVQIDGKILVGGYFTTIGGLTRSNIARLNPDGTLDGGFNPGITGYVPYVTSLAVQADGKVLVGGHFALVGGQMRTNIARLKTDGTLDGAFNPGAAGIDAVVYSVALQANGKILVGGEFTVLGGQQRVGIGRLNADGTLDSEFDPGESGGYSLAVQADGKILVGGSFGILGKQLGVCAARLNPDGTPDNSFNPGVNGAVHSLAIQADGKIVVGGGFTMVGGQPRNRIVRLNADGTVDSGFNSEAGGAVYSLLVQTDGSILVGGDFVTLGGKPRSRIGRFRNSEPAVERLGYDGRIISWFRGGTSPEAWYTSFDISTNGADWVSLGGGTWTPSGWQLTGLDYPLRSTVRARGYVVGGQHSASCWFQEVVTGLPFVTSLPASRTNDFRTFATFSVTAIGMGPLTYQWLRGGMPLTEGTNVVGTQTPVLTLVDVLKADESAYSVVISNAYGSITSTIAGLTVLDPAITSQPLSQTMSNSQTVTLSVGAVGTTPINYQWRKEGIALAGVTGGSLTLSNIQWIDGGNYDVVVCGRSDCITSKVATLSFALTLDSGFDPGANNHVLSFAEQTDGRILVGGGFASIGGKARKYIARLDADGTVDSGFDPGPNNGVGSLAVQGDGKMLLSGWFATLCGEARSRIARLNADGTLDTEFPDPLADGAVVSIAIQPDGKILLGGLFWTLDGQTRKYIARLNANGTLDSGFNPEVNGNVLRDWVG